MKQPHKKLWKNWMTFGIIIGNFNSQVILTLFYVVILMPLGIIMTFVQDPLHIKKKRKTSFSKWLYKTEELDGAKRQY